MVPYVDVHAHLHFDRLKSDLNEILKRAEMSNVIVINSGTDIEGNRKTLELSKNYPFIKASLGLFPTLVSDLNYSILKSEIEFIRTKKNDIVAIGECGLDFAEENYDFKSQKRLFLDLIELSEKIKKPLVVHSRKAELECIEMLESCKHKNIVMHFFSGNFKLVKRIEDNGWLFSIPCKIEKLQHFQMITEKVNINQLVTETDSPYAPPEGEERNEPMFVMKTVKKIAEIKGMDSGEVRNNIFMNYKRVFG